MCKISSPLFAPIIPNSAITELISIWKIELERFSPEEILQWAHATFGSQLVLASSCGQEHQTILSMLEKATLKLKVVEDVHDLLLPEIWPHTTYNNGSKAIERVGAFIEELCKLFEETLGRYQAWIVSAGGSYGTKIRGLPLISWNERFGVFRIAPLAALPQENTSINPEQFSRTDSPHLHFSDRADSRAEIFKSMKFAEIER